MNVNQSPIEIKVEPEINDILPFEDFDIDQFVNYLQTTDDIVNNHDKSPTISGNHQQHSDVPVITNHSDNSEDVISSANDSMKEKLFYTCTVCHETVESGHDLLKHVRTHTKLRGAKNSFNKSSKIRNSGIGPRCCICSKLFNDHRELSYHEKMRHQPPFRCRVCDLKFSRLKTLKNHISNHKSYRYVPDVRKLKSNSKISSGAYKVQTSQSLSSSLQNRYSEPQIIRCRFCSKPFVKRSHLKKHEALHENQNALKPSSPELENGKNQGTKALTLTPSLLSNLNKLANFNSTESRDGKKSAILININTSSGETNEDVKPQETTPVVTNSSGLMISSVKSLDHNFIPKSENKATVVIRNGKQTVSLADVQCPICKKIVSQPFSLKVHLRTHTQEKPYKCTICEKRFSQSCNLRTHMKTHSSLRQSQDHLECQICKKVFTRAASLNNHMLTHRERKLYCYACEINFDEDYINYSQHMQTVHFVSMANDIRMNQTSQNLQNFHHQDQQQTSENPPLIKVEQEDEEYEDQTTPTKVFQVQSTSVANGQIPKLKITLKRESNVQSNAQKNNDGNESDSSTSSSSSNSSSSSSDSDSSSNSSSSSSSSNGQDNNISSN